MTKRLLLLVFLTQVVPISFAQEDIEGEYTRQTKNCFVSSSSPDGWDCQAPLEEGVVIKRRNQNSYYVYLKTRGANGHFCEYNGIGRIRGSVVVTQSTDQACEVFVHVDGVTASFKSEGDGCWAFCGARSTLNASELKKKNRLLKGKNKG
jgi:hypothetical protein